MLDKAKYKQLMTSRETTKKYKYPSFAMETAFGYKYQIAMGTTE